MYSLSDSRSEEGFILTLTALTGPLGKDDPPDVELQIAQDGVWEPLGRARLDTDAWAATFHRSNDSPAILRKASFRAGSASGDP